MNHRITQAALALCLGALSGCLLDGTNQEPSPTSQGATARTYHFTYTTTLPAPTDGATSLNVWVPLPMDDPGVQEVRNLKTSVNGDAQLGRRTQEPVFGNTMLFVELHGVTGETVLAWEADITRYEDIGQGARPTSARYLAPNKLIPLDGDARELADSLGIRGSDLPVRTSARIIFDDVLDNMEYNKKVPGYGMGDFQRSITVCKGNCTDFHARFIGTARASSIPCRFTMGIPMKPAPEGTYNSYHCWAHWHDGSNWHPVDISEADKIIAERPDDARRFFGHLDHDRIALSFGRDLVLEPAQAGEPLNYFVFPYAEADGIPMTLDKSMWEFTWRDL